MKQQTSELTVSALYIGKTLPFLNSKEATVESMPRRQTLSDGLLIGGQGF
jgi:hypothetical protein